MNASCMMRVAFLLAILSLPSAVAAATCESLRSLPLPAPGSKPAWGAAAGGPAPFPIADSHFKYVVFGDPTWDFRTLDFDRDFARAERADGATLTAVDPHLRAFVARGGKLLMYHGWNDQLITAHNSVVARYRGTGSTDDEASFACVAPDAPR